MTTHAEIIHKELDSLLAQLAVMEKKLQESHGKAQNYRLNEAVPYLNSACLLLADAAINIRKARTTL